MLYLSRMDPSRDPKKTRLETSEEMKRRSLAQLGVKEGDDVVAEEEVRNIGWTTLTPRGVRVLIFQQIAEHVPLECQAHKGAHRQPP